MLVKGKYFISDLPVDGVDLEDVERLFGKKLSCASKGRFGIYDILLSLKKNRNYNRMVMIPIYACSSIPWVIRKAGYEVCYYDICESDLNGDLESIKKLHQDTGSNILLIPSLYGNPANLLEIEQFCKKNEIFMIDDAAQAFGATIGGKMVGTFGNSGLFSFSAGKPTYGHMGCFYWGVKVQPKKKRRHLIYHVIEYFNFFYNRYADYNSKKLYRISIINYFKIFLYKLVDISDDDLYEFEKNALLRVVNANLSSWRDERIRVISNVSEIVKNSSLRIITAVRGEPNNNKIVCLTEDENQTLKLVKFLKEHNCYCSLGYQLLENDTKGRYPVANSIYKRVVEIPITANKERNNITIDVICQWIQASKSDVKNKFDM